LNLDVTGHSRRNYPVKNKYILNSEDGAMILLIKLLLLIKSHTQIYMYDFEIAGHKVGNKLNSILNFHITS